MGHSHKVEMILTCTIVLWLVMGFAVQGFRPTLRPGFSRIGQTIVGLSDSDPIPENKASIPGAEISEETPEESLRREKMEKIADLKAQEVFVTRSTGRYECQACGYIYDEAKGYAKRGVPPGTPFDQIEKFRCPECGAKKKYFVSETETVSGFKENLKYGIGTNNLTGGQKANLIYGGLFVGFLIFMSGYLLE